jgi:hypothetical protein
MERLLTGPLRSLLTGPLRRGVGTRAKIGNEKKSTEPTGEIKTLVAGDWVKLA